MLIAKDPDDIGMLGGFGFVVGHGGLLSVKNSARFKVSKTIFMLHASRYANFFILAIAH